MREKVLSAYGTGEADEELEGLDDDDQKVEKPDEPMKSNKDFEEMLDEIPEYLSGTE